jgi:hypothetical protein
MSALFDGFREPPRWRAAQQLRRLSGAIWDWWGLEDIRYLSPMDHAVIHVVGTLDGLADRLDPRW